jgi:hypothetical protein
MSMDLALEGLGGGLVEVTRLGWMMGAGKRWEPGEKLKLLFAGYNGAQIPGPTSELKRCCARCVTSSVTTKSNSSVMSQNFEMTRGYFDKVNQVRLPDIFPPLPLSRSPPIRWRRGLRGLDVQE